MIVSGKPEKVWENSVIEFFIHKADDNSIWFHHNLKVPLSKRVAKEVPEYLMMFAEEVKFAFNVDKIYSWCPTDKVLKWAEFNGCLLCGEINIEGNTFPVVEYK